MKEENIGWNIPDVIGNIKNRVFRFEDGTFTFQTIGERYT